MAEKQYNAREEKRNEDNGKGIDAKSGVSKDDLPMQPQSGKETEVKNAHASGDGSFGRSEGSLPDDEEPEQKVDNNY